MVEYIAEREMTAVAPEGERFTIVARIGRPCLVGEKEWTCPVALDGLYNSLADQHGVDSWQALQLAYSLCLDLLDSFVEKGWKLYLWPGEAPLSQKELREFF